MFGEKVNSDSAGENIASKKEGGKKRVLIFSGALALLLVGFMVGKASMSGEYDSAQKANKNTEALVKNLSDKNIELQNEAKRLQAIIVDRGDKERELADAFQKAISIKEALGVIKNKILAVRENGDRIKKSYISDNSEVGNLDSKVIRELINVVDIDMNKQITELGKAFNVLSNYQKNKTMVIRQPEKEDISSQAPVAQKNITSTEEKSPEAEIEPLNFNRSVQ